MDEMDFVYECLERLTQRGIHPIQYFTWSYFLKFSIEYSIFFFWSAVILDLPSSYKWMGYFCFSSNTNGLIIFLKLSSELVCTFLLVSIHVVDTFNLIRETSSSSLGRRSLNDFGPVTMCCRIDIVGINLNKLLYFSYFEKVESKLTN